MKRAIFIAIFCFLCQCAYSQTAPRTLLTEGKEFILVFNQTEFDSLPEIQYLKKSELFFLTSGTDTAQVVIRSNAFPSYLKTLTVPPDTLIQYRISDDINPTVYSTGVIDRRTVRVSSTAPIKCYSSCLQYYGARFEDSYEAIPINELGKRYFVMSYESFTFYPHNQSDITLYSGVFSIAAPYNETSVTIKLSSATTAGDDYKKELHFLLGAGDCIQFQSKLSKGFDLTGTEIISSSPIAVYGGHRATEVPNIGVLGNSSARSSIVEAIRPIDTWGKSFAVRKTPPHEGEYMTPINGGVEDSSWDKIRIVASEDNTVLSINGNVWGTPLLSGTFRDTVCPYPLLIEASSPVMVAQLKHHIYGFTSGGDTANGGMMMMIPPLESIHNKYTFYSHPFDSIYDWEIEDIRKHGFTHQYVMITTAKEGRGKIRIDGKLMPDSGFIDLPIALNGKQYSIGSYQVDGGVHTVTSDLSAEMGFVATAFGFGKEKAYGYCVGRGVLSQTKVVDNQLIDNWANITKSIRPNPTNADVTITFESFTDDKAELQLLDELGKIVYEETFATKRGENEHSLVIPKHWSGTFYLRLQMGKDVVTGKFVKQ